MTVLDAINSVQTRSLHRVRSAQDQVASYNERLADTVTDVLPDFRPPFVRHLPSPTEVVKTYFSFIGELHQANLDFATRITSAWEGSEPEPVKAEPKKAAPKKATPKKAKAKTKTPTKKAK
jgi:hypothetical protein